MYEVKFIFIFQKIVGGKTGGGGNIFVKTN